MQPGPSASYPFSIERPDARVRSERLVRLALGAWALVVYVVYWLGWLGLR
jgi:hypothetical protein